MKRSSEDRARRNRKKRGKAIISRAFPRNIQRKTNICNKHPDNIKTGVTVQDGVTSVVGMLIDINISYRGECQPVKSLNTHIQKALFALLRVISVKEFHKAVEELFCPAVKSCFFIVVCADIFGIRH